MRTDRRLPKVIWEQAASPPWWQSCRLQSFNRIYNVALMCTPPNTRFLGPHPCTHDPKRYLDRFTEVSKWPVKFGVRSDRLSVCMLTTVSYGDATDLMEMCFGGAPRTVYQTEFGSPSNGQNCREITWRSVM